MTINRLNIFEADLNQSGKFKLMHNARFYTYLNKKKSVCLAWMMNMTDTCKQGCHNTFLHRDSGLPPKLEDYQQFLSNLENLRYLYIKRYHSIYQRIF